MLVRDTRPQDTLENVIAAGMNPAEWGSCAKHIDGEVVGCPFYARNPKTGRGGGCPWRDRPKLGAVQSLKTLSNGMGSERTTVMHCYDYLALKPQTESNNAVMKWVADEGETYTARETKALPIQPGQSVAIHEDVFLAKIVPEFKGVREKFKLTARIAELREQRQAEKLQRTEDRILGVEPDAADPKSEPVVPDAISGS